MFFEDLSDGPVPWQQLFPFPTHFSLGFSSFFKGVEATKIVLSILPNKREHTQAGLDSHLKTLYSLTLVLLFSLSFSQSKGLASSQHVIYLPFGLPLPNRKHK